MQLENNTHNLICTFLYEHLESKSNFVFSSSATAKILCVWSLFYIVEHIQVKERI